MLSSERARGVDTLEAYAAFRNRIFEHRDRLLEQFDDWERRGAAVYGYGASTKGNVILQFCGITPRQLPAIAEVNSDKFGKMTPGTHIPIIAEAEARAMNPDFFLVLPWHFRNNIVQRERSYLARGGRLAFPLPTIEIIAK
jgi:hypothetical protein